MAASRKTGRSTRTTIHSMGRVSPRGSEAQPFSLSPACAPADGNPAPAVPPLKKRRPPNAFILFRSYMIANKFYPPELKHQNDLSCYVAEVWRNAPEGYRATFFRMAEVAKRRIEIEMPGGAVPAKRARRRKPRKSIPSDSGTLHYPLQSPSSDPGRLASPHAFLSSPATAQGTAAPTYTFLIQCDIMSFPLHAPQPIHPIPPSLFYWGQEADELEHGALDLDSPACESLPSSHSRWPSVMTYQSDAGTRRELGLMGSPEMDMPWPMDYRLDIGTALQQPPFGVYLFP